jgi:type I restriction enzyme R subunit
VIAPGRIIPLGRRPTRQGARRPDYVLSLRRNYPIAGVEAKAEYRQPDDGLQQALNYAEMLGVKFAYANHGHGIVEHDFITGS